MKAEAEEFLDEFWDREWDRISARNIYRVQQQEHEDKIRASQRQALSTPFNIAALDVERKKRYSATKPDGHEFDDVNIVLENQKKNQKHVRNGLNHQHKIHLGWKEKCLLKVLIYIY
jgi:hypothetical protein